MVKHCGDIQSFQITLIFTAQKKLFRKKSMIAGVLKSENSNFYTCFILEIACWSKLNLDMLIERQTEDKK